MDIEKAAKAVAEFQAETTAQVHLLEPQFRKWCEDYIAAGDPVYRRGAAPVVRAVAMILGRWIAEKAPMRPDQVAELIYWSIAQGASDVLTQPPPERTN